MNRKNNRTKNDSINDHSPFPTVGCYRKQKQTINTTSYNKSNINGFWVVDYPYSSIKRKSVTSIWIQLLSKMTSRIVPRFRPYSSLTNSRHHKRFTCGIRSHILDYSLNSILYCSSLFQTSIDNKGRICMWLVHNCLQLCVTLIMIH